MQAFNTSPIGYNEDSTFHQKYVTIKMKKKLLKILLVTLLSLVYNISQGQQFTIYNSWDFESEGLGQYTDAEISEDFDYGVLNSHNSADIVTDTINNTATKVMRITHIENSLSVGFEMSVKLDDEYDEIYSSYNWKFGEEYNSTSGGKIPGFRALPHWSGHMCPLAGEGFVAANMHKEAGRLISYHYDRTTGTCPWAVDDYDYDTVYLNNGNWYNITQRLVMNTFTSGVANADGIKELWVDGRLVYQIANLKFTETESDTLKIDAFALWNFYGGATDDYKPATECYGYIDNLKIWMPGDDSISGDELHNPSTIMPTPDVITDKDVYYDSLITSEGSLSNAEYGSNYSPCIDEAYLIDAGEGNTVEFNITAGGLGGGDYLFFYDGKTTDSEMIEMIKGYDVTINGSRQSTGRYMFIRFSSNTDGGITGWTGTLSFSGDIQAPLSPSGLSVTDSTSNSISIFWTDNSSNENNFIIERSTGTFTVIDSVNANITSYTDTGLTPNTTYTYRVKARNSAGDSGYTNELSVTTENTAPPSAFKRIYVNNGSPAEMNSTIYQLNSGFTTHTIGTEAGNSFFDGLIDEVVYFDYALSSSQVSSLYNASNEFDSYGNAAIHYWNMNESSGNMLDGIGSSNGTVSCTQNISGHFNTAYEFNGTDDLVSLTAGMSENANEFSISMWVFPHSLTASRGIWSESVNAWWQNSLTVGTWYSRDTLTGTTGTRDDDLTVPTLTQNAWNHIVMVYSVSGELMPIAPSGLQATDTTTTSISLSWTDNASDEDRYIIERSTGTFAAIDTVNANVITFTDTGLDSGTTYTYRVKAQNSQGDSWYSNLLTVTTQSIPLASAFKRIYVNNSTPSEVNSSVYQLNSGFTTHSIGKEPGGNYFDGLIDEVVYFDYALDSSQVSSLYNATGEFDSYGNAAAHYWNMNESSGNMLDGIGSSNGTVSCTQNVSGHFNTAYEFDGTDDLVSLTAGMSENVNEFSISMWVYPHSLTASMGIWSESINAWWQNSLTVGTWYSRDTLTGATGTRDDDLTVPTLTQNAWNHIVMVYSVSGELMPIAPSGLQATDTTTTSISLSWTDNGSDEDRYIIERSTGTFAAIDTVDANVTTYTDTGLDSGTTYTYRVKAQNNNGDSWYSNVLTESTSGGSELDTVLVNTIKINLTLTGYSGGSEWNDFMNNSQGSSISLDDSLGNSTGYTLYNEDGVDAWYTGETSGPYPQNVNMTFWWKETNESDMELRSLDDDNLYSIEVYGSRGNVGDTRETRVTIGSDFDIITVSNNTSDKAIFPYVCPSSGVIRMAITPETGIYSYINAIVVREYEVSLKQAHLSEKINLEKQTEQPITIYPNPGSNTITISGFDRAQEIKMVDMLGKVVFQTGQANNSKQINVSNLKKGLYLIVLKTDHKHHLKKFIKN